MNFPEDREAVRRAKWILVLVGVIACTLAYGFTTRSPDERERARARVMLESIYRLQMAHHAETGTYFASNRANTQEVLKLADPPGRFRYRVERTYGGFVAYAEADLNGDGNLEVWRVDSRNADPRKVRED